MVASLVEGFDTLCKDCSPKAVVEVWKRNVVLARIVDVVYSDPDGHKSLVLVERVLLCETRLRICKELLCLIHQGDGKVVVQWSTSRH